MLFSPLTYKMTEILKCTFQYLRRDNVISHIPKTRLRVRCVGESETFHFRGDGADDSICILVGLLHHTHIPTAGLQKCLSLTVQAKTSFHNPHITTSPTNQSPPLILLGTYPTTYITTKNWVNLNTNPTPKLGITSVFGVS